MSRLDEIRERLAKATLAPWHGSLSRDGTGSVWVDVAGFEGDVQQVDVCREATWADVELIANCPEDIAYLLSLLGEPG